MVHYFEGPDAGVDAVTSDLDDTVYVAGSYRGFLHVGTTVVDEGQAFLIALDREAITHWGVGLENRSSAGPVIALWAGGVVVGAHEQVFAFDADGRTPSRMAAESGVTDVATWAGAAPVWVAFYLRDVRAYGASGGQLASWSAHTGETPRRIAARPDGVVVRTDRRVVWLGSDGREQRSVPVESGLSPSTALAVDARSRVFIAVGAGSNVAGHAIPAVDGGESSVLCALAPSGSLQWAWRPDRGGEIHAIAVAPIGVVVAGATRDGSAYVAALDMSGHEQWHVYPLGEHPAKPGGVSVARDGSIFIGGTADPSVAFVARIDPCVTR